MNIHAHLYGKNKGILRATQKITQVVYQWPYKMWYLRPDTATKICHILKFFINLCEEEDSKSAFMITGHFSTC